MRHIPLNCTCCELYVDRDSSGYTRYTLNGRSYIGRDNFAERIGLGRAQLLWRMRKRRCLEGGHSTGYLAQQFIVNMGRAFA